MCYDIYKFIVSKKEQSAKRLISHFSLAKQGCNGSS